MLRRRTTSSTCRNAGFLTQSLLAFVPRLRTLLTALLQDGDKAELSLTETEEMPRSGHLLETRIDATPVLAGSRSGA